MGWERALAAIVAMVGWLLALPKCGVFRIPSQPPDSVPVDVEARWRKALERDTPGPSGEKYLVIGAGSLGQRIIDVLLLRQEQSIRVFDVAACPQKYNGDPRILWIRGDVRKQVDVEEACQGISAVFATFAVIRFQQRMPFQAAVSEQTNITGTENVVSACRRTGVRRLIQTSTCGVVLSPDLCKTDMDESSPYVTRAASMNHYTWTKAVAERLVLEAAAPDLQTCSVRVCSAMIGPRDVILTQKFQDLGVMVVPEPRARLDFTYVDNVVWCHLLAERALRDGRPGISGEVFCVTNRDPISIWTLLKGIQYFKPSLWLFPAPYYILRFASHFVEWLQWLTRDRLWLGALADLTPAAILNSSLSYTFTDKKAGRLLGYAPLFTVDEALQLCVTGYEQSKYN